MTTLYRIASLKHTHQGHEHITWWGPNHCGYTPVLGGQCGVYSAEEAAALNNGESCIAVPVDVVDVLAVPEPYCIAPVRKFYDQIGPVVENTKGMWAQLITLSLDVGRRQKPKPEPFKGLRRSFSAAPKTEGSAK